MYVLCSSLGSKVRTRANKQLLAAPREVSGPLLFDRWAGLTYLPIPSARQAQKIYVAGKCLTDFLREKPVYLPPMSLLLGGFGVQLLAIRDTAADAYDSYEARYSAQGGVVTQRLLRATYQSARSILSAPLPGKTRELSSVIARVAGRAGVTSAKARQAVRSASVTLATQDSAKIQQCEQEMPVEAAVDWFARNRQCIWRAGDS